MSSSYSSRLKNYFKPFLALISFTLYPPPLLAEVDYNVSELTSEDRTFIPGFAKAAGDVNGDGFDDVIYKSTSTSTLDSYSLHLGGSQGVQTIPDVTFTTSLATNFLYPNRREPLGDFNGDGLDDFFVANCVVYGAETLGSNIDLDSIDTSTGFCLTDSSNNKSDVETRYTLNGVGDLNNDGLQDLGIVWAIQSETDQYSYSETFYVLYGNDLETNVLDLSLLSSGDGFKIERANSASSRGISYLQTMSDINGDGIDDLAIVGFGLLTGNNFTTGILYGNPNQSFESSTDTLFEDPSEGFYINTSIHGFSLYTSTKLGDVNGDGRDDYLLDANNILLGYEGVIEGPVNINDINNSLTGIQFIPFDRGAAAGADIDGDGFADWIAGNSYWAYFDGTEIFDYIGRAYLLFGSTNAFGDIPLDSFDYGPNPGILSEEFGISITGESEESYLGITISSLGDVNNDGYDDIYIDHVGVLYGRSRADWLAGPILPPEPNILTTYRTGFQGPNQSAGWNYYWNPTASIGDSSKYEQLKWAEWNYDNDGVSARVDDQFNYGNLNQYGGHPGKGNEQGGVSHDRYVIAAYQAGQDGTYAIQDSFINHTILSCSEWSNGDDVRVYVNDSLRLSVLLPKQGSTSFDTSLGDLNAGDQIYVAIGPNGKDGCDGFTMDYAISLEGEVSNTAPVLTPLNDLNTDEGVSASMSVSASDIEGGSLAYSANGLPDGVSISSTGIISGTPSNAGSYTVTATVTDEAGAYDVITFNWTVGSAGTVIADYYDDFAGDNWTYTWNQNSVIGDRSGYVNLVSNGYEFHSGETSYPASSELGYGFLGPRASHPGNGVDEATSDRFVITGYSVEQAGNYRLGDATVEHLTSTCSTWSNGLEVRIFVDDNLIDALFVDKESLNNIETVLGDVSAGQTIYIAVGPNGKAGCDKFSMDYSIVME